nr:hypothetical protein [Arthrobacter sp. 9AX]
MISKTRHARSLRRPARTRSISYRPEPKWAGATMTEQQLCRIIHDPLGPEHITSRLSDRALVILLDSLYQSLDTPDPDPAAIFWYEAGVDESLRRASQPSKTPSDPSPH